MANAEKIDAPFTADQVDALNEFQRLECIHEFTCIGHDGGGSRSLVATRNGWICCHCDYRQTWAHAFMADRVLLEKARRRFAS